MRNTVGIYWREIKDFEPLNRREEAELARQTRAGDDEARNRLITANLRFVVSEARPYIDKGLSFSELISAGNMGLLEAVKRYDETRGFKFITYAVWWIRQAIYQALSRTDRIVIPPTSHLRDWMKVDVNNHLIAHKYGRMPTYEEVGENLGFTSQRIRNALEASEKNYFLDQPIQPDGKESLNSIFSTGEPDASEKQENDAMVEAVRESLAVLDEREYRVITSYFGLYGQQPLSLEQVGKNIGLTREWVRQVRDKGLEKIRSHYGRLLAEFIRN